MTNPAIGAADDHRPAHDAAGPSTRSDRTAWLEPIVCAPGDDEETRRRKVQFTLVSVLVTPAGLIWAAIYFAYGERTVALFPLAYSVFTLLDFLVLVRVRRYELFRMVQQGLILVLPVALQAGLGGFVGGSIVIIWSFLTILMAVLFGGIREARWWFAAFLVAVVASALVESRLPVDNRLPHWLVLSFFVLNIGTVSWIAFVVLSVFVADRRRLRELEVAYLKQDLMLRQSEKLATLGTLAAGVAHELNNPAAATRRAAEQLRDAFARLEQAHLRLESAALTPAGRDVLRSLDEQARARAIRPSDLDAVARADREAAVEHWLEEHEVANPWELAPALAALGLDPSGPSLLADALAGEALAPALTWAASAFTVYTLVNEIGQGSARVSEIVRALKSYSYVGQAPVQAVDLHEGLDNTLVILGSKLKEGITVHRDYGADVPPVPAYGSELNQVWTNLLDNAADAMGGKGAITIRTRRRNGWAVVEIEDDGPGIPPAIQSKVFDPFFTTKGPGQGTGLGLSTSHSIITDRHKGAIAVESRPGFTRFTVRLPLAESPVVPSPGA